MPCCKTQPSDSVCRPQTAGIASDYTLKGLIDNYRANYPAPFKGIDDLSSILDYVCGLHNDKPELKPKFRRCSHQSCISNDVIIKMATKLANIESIQFKDFEELRQYVSNKRVTGFGDLCVYDFCVRYAWSRNLRPRKYVYIHAGAMKGAKALYTSGYLQTKPQVPSMPVEAFPKELQNLDAMDIENFLCIYHKQLKKLQPIK